MLFKNSSPNVLHQTSGRGALFRLVALLTVDRKFIFLLFLFQALQALSYIPFSAAITYLIDHIINGSFPELSGDAVTQHKFWLLCAWAGSILCLWPLHSWFTVRAFFYSQGLTRTTTARLRRLIIDQLQRLSLSYFTRRGSGALSNQVTVDLGRVENFMSNVVGGLFVSLSISFFASIYVLWLNWQLGLLALISVPLQILVLRFASKKVKSLNKTVQKTNEDFSSKIVEFISGMRITKSLGNEELVADQLSELVEDIRISGLRQSVFMRWLFMVIQFIGEYSTTLTWCAAALMVIVEHATLGEIVGLMSVLNFVRSGFQAALSAYDNWQQAKPGMDALLEIIDSRELEEFHCPKVRNTIQGHLTFKNVWFHYPGGNSKNIFENLNLEIPSGQRIGLVGETGAGKSTFLDLVMGFYHPQEGQVLFDNHTITEVGQLNLRRACAIMGQDAFLWNTSIRENIRFGRPQASDEEIEEAAIKAQAHEFILRLEHGYETLCGERGGKLSGGQRQRIALSRLFLRQPRIVILDEPTSALDLETEAKLQDDLDDFCNNRTTFIVAHRLSTLRGVDRILVFSKGKIIEDGTTQELLSRPNGHYAHLHSLSSIKV
jgi:ABC-type multidrug transport system fused ATPase/permease subunit